MGKFRNPLTQIEELACRFSRSSDGLEDEECRRLSQREWSDVCVAQRLECLSPVGLRH